jgi:hypothetical protein
MLQMLQMRWTGPEQLGRRACLHTLILVAAWFPARWLIAKLCSILRLVFRAQTTAMWAPDSTPIIRGLPMRTAVGEWCWADVARESLHSEKPSDGASASPPKAGASGCILGFRQTFLCAE